MTLAGLLAELVGKQALARGVKEQTETVQLAAVALPDIRLAMEEIDRREKVFAESNFHGVGASIGWPRLNALQSVTDDIVAGRWKPRAIAVDYETEHVC